MRCSALSLLAFASLLVNAAPTKFEPVLAKKNNIAGQYRALAHQKRQDGLLILGGPGDGVSIASEEPLATAAQLPTQRTSFLANPRETQDSPKNPKLTMQLAAEQTISSSSSLPSSSSSVESSSTSTFTSSQSASSTSSSAPAASSSSSVLHGPVSGSYYPDWSSDVLPPAAVEYSKFNLIYFAFALPDENFNLYFTQTNSVTLLNEIVRRSHEAGTQVVVSVGGWTGSKYFSPAVATSDSRSKFAKNLAQMVWDHNLDGIDLDWEYPGGPGNPGNIYSGSDSQNLLLLLQELRDLIGPDKLITMATAHNAFKGPTGAPLDDVSAHAAILDHILLMNYDVWGASENPGPNAPLDNACGNSLQPGASAKAGIDQWANAGMPLSKIVLGLPAYGYVSQSSADRLVTRRRRSIEPEQVLQRKAVPRSQWMAAGVKERRKRDLARTVVDPESGASITVCPENHGGNGCHPTTTAKATSGPSLPSGLRAPSIKASNSGDLSQYRGSQVGFNSLVSMGVLSRGSDGKYNAINGYERLWDSCSSTPFLRNAVRNTVVTYDDPDSIYLKARYAASRGIGGIAFWDAATDDQYALMDSARAGFGFV